MCIQSSSNLGAVSGSGKTSIVPSALQQPIKQAEVSFGVFYSTAEFPLLHFSNGHGFPFSTAEGNGAVPTFSLSRFISALARTALLE